MYMSMSILQMCILGMSIVTMPICKNVNFNVYPEDVYKQN